MNKPDIEARLKHAIAVAGSSRSIADDVMRQIPLSPPVSVPRSRGQHPFLVANLAISSVVAATIVFLCFFTGPAVRLSMADIEAAVERQAWVHVRYDVGPFKENWTNLRTGEVFTTRTDGGAVYVNRQTNTRLFYWKNSGVIQQDSPVRHAPGQSPVPWTPRTAWEQIVGPLEAAAAATEHANTSSPTYVRAQDSLDGKPAIRFDSYASDSLGKRFLLAQLWADPKTQLPVRVCTRLQLGEREADGKEWSTGDYDFPASGPDDLYALGVPRGTPIAKDVENAPATVRPVLDGIHRAHDSFLKNYRAVIWSVRKGGDEQLDELDIIWRQDETLRQDHHLPGFEIQENHAPPLPPPQLAAILAWAKQSDAAIKQLMDNDREYTWRSAAVAKASKPKVHVIRHDRFPLLDSNCWPERIQWPMWRYGQDFQLLDANIDTVAGCIGLRRERGNSRTDFYIDAKNDFVCVKEIDWTKRGAEWAKTREYRLSGLHRVQGHVVANEWHMSDYGDPARGLSSYDLTRSIDIVPFAETDYPPGIFDPASLTTGADVEGY